MTKIFNCLLVFQLVPNISMFVAIQLTHPHVLPFLSKTTQQQHNNSTSSNTSIPP
jgi:hypothetical protein